MNYSVFLFSSAQKALEKLPEEPRRRVYSALRNLCQNPRPPGCKKLQNSDYWRIRIGDYRAVYEIDDSKKAVLVLRIAHRSKVYR